MAGADRSPASQVSAPRSAENVTASLLKSRPHFEALDGLRGVAALAVVTFHFMEFVIPDYSKNFVGHGFLAVDFFFCLSGFVIGYAYDDRVAKMGLVEFFKSRLIRLHPLVVMGSVLGLLALAFDPLRGPYSPHVAVGKLVLMFLTSALLIPFPVMAARSHNLFPLNAPSWSLFWEYVANIAFALVLWRIRRRWLGALLFVAAALLCWVGARAETLAGGWSGGTFWDGGARVAYSFMAGLLVYRSRWIIRTRLGFTALTVLLLAALMMPYFRWNWQAEWLVVVLYFPLLVALGAGATLNRRSESLCIFSGKMSYPLYMSHYAAIWIFGNYLSGHKPGMGKQALAVTTGVLALTGFAYLVMAGYDIPVRRYLTARRLARASGRG